MEKEQANVFILAKDGDYVEQEILEVIREILEKEFEIANAPEMIHMMIESSYKTGKRVLNANNDPSYLVGQLEESEYQPIVVAWAFNDDGMPAPAFMVSDYEIGALIGALKDYPDLDAWEITIEVNRLIRSKDQESED